MNEPLEILDDCARSFTFPCLDNGYFYLAACRLSVFLDQRDWAVVIETFGSNPRADGPGLIVETFGSNVDNRKTADQYVSRAAHAAYLARQPFNETSFFWPVDEARWMDKDDPELVSTDEAAAILRNREVPIPNLEQLAAVGINPSGERPMVFEAARYWAHHHRDLVLATTSERRAHVQQSMSQVLVLDQWRHPDVADGEMPSDTDCFRQLADVITTSDPSRYTASEEPNTHWRNWPFGGTL